MLPRSYDAGSIAMSGKVRLSASVDAELMVAAADSVAAGSAPSLSAWVSAAMRRHLEHERSLSALGAYLAAFEAENGIITDEAISSARRATRARAINVRKRIPAPSAGKGSRADRKAR